MASLRAVATAATCWPRRARTRRKKARNGPGARAAAQAASTSMPRACPRPLLGDPPMVGRPGSGLSDAWVQAKVTDQLLGAVEAPNIANGRLECERHDQIDAGDRHQTCDTGSGRWTRVEASWV